MYELAALTSQSEKGVDVDWFLADYSRRRYGGYSVRQPGAHDLPVGTGQGAFLAGFIVGNNPIAGSPGYLGPGEWYDPAKHGEMGKEEAYDRAREAGRFWVRRCTGPARRARTRTTCATRARGSRRSGG